jgi:hypothetical protein
MFLTPSTPANAAPRPARRFGCWPIGRLMSYVYNPRLHTKADYDTLTAVMLTLGWAISVLVDKEGVPPAEMGRIPVS